MHIPHFKYQVKAHSSHKVHRNHFFPLNKQNKYSESKGKFRQASNHCKRFLAAAKLAYANKTKESVTYQTTDSQDFWRIANSVLNKGKSTIPPLFNELVVLSSASDKAILFPKNFLETLILIILVSLYLYSHLELICNCIFLYLTRWLKRS